MGAVSDPACIGQGNHTNTFINQLCNPNHYTHVYLNALYSCGMLVELHLSKASLQLYGVKQVANFRWLQIDCLVLVIIRSDYILPALVRAVGPYSSRLDNRARADHVIVRTFTECLFHWQPPTGG
jgi:hypothetical protein